MERGFLTLSTLKELLAHLLSTNFSFFIDIVAASPLSKIKTREVLIKLDNRPDILKIILIFMHLSTLIFVE